MEALKVKGHYNISQKQHFYKTYFTTRHVFLQNVLEFCDI